MVEPQPSKLVVWVRFPSSAPGVAPQAIRVIRHGVDRCKAARVQGIPRDVACTLYFPSRLKGEGPPGRGETRYAGQRMPPKMRQ